MQFITASKLYNYTQCPHRVWRDVWGPQEEKIKETNPFVQMLWDKGVQHEENIIKEIGEYADMSNGTYDDRFKRTIKLMKDKAPLIYQGVLQFKNMRGIPDLLRLLPNGTYAPIEIKSGMAYSGSSDEESDELGKPKKHYAVQLAMYIDLLNCLGFEHNHLGRVIDIRGDEVDYNLGSALGKRDKTTIWDFYEQTKNNVEVLINNEDQNKPALSSICKLCPWHNSCKKWINESDDLTKIYYVGRAKRDTINMDLGIEKALDILSLDVDEILSQKKKDKNFMKGVADKTLNAILNRARVLLQTKKPVAYRKIEFPKVSYELFFDIEDDPTQEFIYMHGVYEKSPKGEEFKHFTATEISPEEEKNAWKRFWDYIRTLPQDDFAVYYYSHHEKTTYKKMQKLYPDVVTEKEVEDFFANSNVIDLFRIVSKDTDWPVSSYSLKELAQYLGFRWRDKSPSGALSIQWFNEYIKTKDDAILNRILEYNEDDCRATMVLKEGIEKI
jgi:uncharacterized protein